MHDNGSTSCDQFKESYLNIKSAHSGDDLVVGVVTNLGSVCSDRTILVLCLVLVLCLGHIYPVPSTLLLVATDVCICLF